MTSESGGKHSIREEADITAVRQEIRAAAKAVGFGITDVTRIVTTASELARNIFRYAGGGEVLWRQVRQGYKPGLEMTFRDSGPGIADVELALEPGYTSGGGLGMGLSGAKRLMDEFEIETEPGQGTTIVVRKWLN